MTREQLELEGWKFEKQEWGGVSEFYSRDNLWLFLIRTKSWPLRITIFLRDPAAFLQIMPDAEQLRVCMPCETIEDLNTIIKIGRLTEYELFGFPKNKTTT